MNCVICERPIEPGRSVYRQVVGFVRDRKGGGVNSIRAQEPTGEYAHADCVDHKVSGLEQIPGQMSLV